MFFRLIARTFAAGCAAATLGATASASNFQGLPEPLVFDLVRPLGSPRGEFEINSLFRQPLGGSDRTLEWAPEAEYTFADGYGIELEFPFENGRLAAYKIGLQGTFGAPRSNRGRFIHGWQYLGEYLRDDGAFKHTATYIAGVRLNDRWSTLNMVGAQVQETPTGAVATAIVNGNLFYTISAKSIGGFEVNLRRGASPGVVLMPQFHQKLSTAYNLQIGLGAEKQRGTGFSPQFAWRIIREF